MENNPPSIAVLLTCFNRREKTLHCLESLIKSANACAHDLEIKIYITDDNSSDGTQEEIQSRFPEVNLIHGSGSLFWSEGMRSSWNKAMEVGFDYYLLVNDDVIVHENLFHLCLQSIQLLKEQDNSSFILVGTTKDREGSRTYGGSIVKNSFLYTQIKLEPNGKLQSCDLANANILLVNAMTVQKIGILPSGYLHGISDYDYTLNASRSGIGVYVLPEYCGLCEYDHSDPYLRIKNASKKERKELVANRKVLDAHSYLRFMKKYFPIRYPFVYFAYYLKVHIPGLYFFIVRIVRPNYSPGK